MSTVVTAETTIVNWVRSSLEYDKACSKLLETIYTFYPTASSFVNNKDVIKAYILKGFPDDEQEFFNNALRLKGTHLHTPSEKRERKIAEGIGKKLTREYTKLGVLCYDEQFKALIAKDKSQVVSISIFNISLSLLIKIVFNI